jgi:DNA repair photolyase
MEAPTGSLPVPLLRQAFPPPPEKAGKRPAVRVQEAETQRPLIVQGRRSFIAQFDTTLATYSGCPFACLTCYVPSVQWHLPDKLGGWGNYVHTRTTSPQWLSRHIEEVRGASIFLSATTDPYNPMEQEHGLTRKLLEILADSAMGFLLISTRGTLVTRDIDLFTDVRMRGRVEIGISIPSDLDLPVHAAIEPYTPSFKKRFGSARVLRAAGIPVRIHAAPLALHSPEFYTLAEECADWLWIDELRHSAEISPTLQAWFYAEDEVRQLVEQAKSFPSFGAARVGCGSEQFGWRWDAGGQCIVPPPPRVKFLPEKRKGVNSHG